MLTVFPPWNGKHSPRGAFASIQSLIFWAAIPKNLDSIYWTLQERELAHKEVYREVGRVLSHNITSSLVQVPHGPAWEAHTHAFMRQCVRWNVSGTIRDLNKCWWVLMEELSVMIYISSANCMCASYLGMFNWDYTNPLLSCHCTNVS